MFKYIHWRAPHYLSDDVTMHVDIHGFDKKKGFEYEIIFTEIYDRSFCIMGSILYYI